MLILRIELCFQKMWVEIIFAMLNLEADTSFCVCTQTDLQNLFLMKVEKETKKLSWKWQGWSYLACSLWR